MTMHARTGFSAPLRDFVHLSRDKIHQWVENEKAKVDVLFESRRRMVDAHQSRIDQTVTNLLALQLEGGLTMNDDATTDQASLKDKKDQVMKQQEDIKAECEHISTKMEEKRKQVLELRTELVEHKSRAQEARRNKENVELSKQTTIDDLTRGIVNYSYLALFFEKAQDEALRFVFTHIDPSDPEKRYSFVLQTDDEDNYQIHECEPRLPTETTRRLLEELNEKEDMSAFVRKTRQAFVASLS